MSASLKATFGSSLGRHAGQQREGAVVQFHDHAVQRLLGLRQVEQIQDDRRILAEQIAIGDAKQNSVADLASGAGHGNAHGGFHL